MVICDSSKSLAQIVGLIPTVANNFFRAGDAQAQRFVISRLQAQLAGEKEAQQATISRIAAQLSGEKVAQEAGVMRLEAGR